MKKKTDLTERNYSRQQSIIVNARYALTRAEIDIVLVLLTAIHKEDKDFKDYEFTIKDLEIKTDRQWNSKQLKDTVKSLMGKPLEIPKGDDGWSIVNWFSHFGYNGSGTISCTFDKRLKPYLLDIQGRMVLGDVRHLLPMKSSYSKRIYLLLKEYAKFGVRKFETEELMELLKVPKSLLRYSQFKQKVLERAVTDINKYTDLKVSFDEKKVRRKVTEVTFHIKKNDKELEAFKDLIKEEHYHQKLYEFDGKMTYCNRNGELYYFDDDLYEILHPKKYAESCWKQLFKRKNVLPIFTQPSLFQIP